MFKSSRRGSAIDRIRRSLLDYIAAAPAPPPVDDYLLRATFDADDVGYADGQVLDTAAEMGANFVGQLTVVEQDGTLAIVSNECAFTAQGTPAWGDLGLYSEAITKVLGYGLLAKVTLNADNTQMAPVAWKEAQNVDVSAGNRYQLLALNTAVFQVGWDVSSLALLDAYAAATEYNVALLLGGYDNGGAPWYPGAVGTYDYGVAYYVKGGAYATWTLLWRQLETNTATLYAVTSNYDAAGELDDFRVPDLALTDAMEPTNVDRFTDGNGTSLDAHVPDYGGMWTEHQNQAEIQSNRAENVTAGGGNNVYATVDSGVSDALIEATLRVGGPSFMGLVARYTDTTHFWGLMLTVSGASINIYEYNGGAPVLRASEGHGFNDNTDYPMKAILDGQSIRVYADGVWCSYGLAAMNETETRHGMWLDDATSGPGYCDNFAIYPRTHADYDTTLDAV